MRHDKRVTLVSESKKRYDPDLGKMVGGERTEKVVPCHISPVRSELINQLGDKLADVTSVVKIGQYRGKVDRLIIDGRPFYIVKSANHGLHGQAFYVAEVQNG